MSHLHWSSELDTGIEDIDNQHKRIVDFVNELNSAVENNDSNATSQVLKQLVDYTLTHFSFEEDLMERAGYSFLRAHKRVHDMFTTRVQEFEARAAAGENVAPELITMLKIWLVNHIKGDDADYAEAVRKMLGVSKPDVKVAGGWLGGALHKLFE